MKRVFLPILSALVFVISLTPFSYAAGARTVTILYTGAVKGTIAPCPS